MIALGFNFQKGRIRVTSLSSSSGNLAFGEARIISIDPQLPIPELMDRYASQFRALIDEFKPDIVSARQIWDSKNIDAALCQVAPFGILALVCSQKNQQFTSYTSQALRQPARFNLPKGTKPVDAVDEKFGVHPPNWDDMQRTSLVAAWRALLDAK